MFGRICATFSLAHKNASEKIASWLAPFDANRIEPCTGTLPGSPHAQPETDARSSASTDAMIKP
jgi:hypothetical protein